MHLDFYISKIECYAVWYQNLLPHEKTTALGRDILNRMHFYSELVQQIIDEKYNKVEAFTFELN